MIVIAIVIAIVIVVVLLIVTMVVIATVTVVALVVVTALRPDLDGVPMNMPQRWVRGSMSRRSGLDRAGGLAREDAGGLSGESVRAMAGDGPQKEVLGKAAVGNASVGNASVGKEAVIEVEDLHVVFGDRAVLSGMNLRVYRGETLVILGGSGSGKSTLLRVLIGALEPAAGRVEVLGREIYRVDEDSLTQVKKRFGILFQSGALYNSMTVGDNLALPLREHTDLDEGIIRIMGKMKLELVGLRDFESLMPSQLSGGMRKRVGLARALALDPEIIFYDEPGAGLDPITAGVIDKLISDLSRKLGVTSVVVTHEMESAFRIADRMVLLYEGKIEAEGTPAEFRQSTNPFVRQFVHGEPDGPIPLRRSKINYEDDLLA